MRFTTHHDDPVAVDVVRRRLATLAREGAPRRLWESDVGRLSADWTLTLVHDGASSSGGLVPPDSLGADHRTAESGATGVEWVSDRQSDAALRPPADDTARPSIAASVVRPLDLTSVRSALQGWIGQALAFSRAHVSVVAIIVVSGLLWSGYSVLSTRSLPAAVAVTAIPSASPSTPAPAVLVHVLGAVHRPGVVTLPKGSRVADAISATGGLREDADPADLNLAAIVSDGSQLIIGTRNDPGGQMRSGSPGVTDGGGGGLVNLNTATLEQLDALPGVGPVTAQRIVAWRAAHGEFTRVSQLQEVEGIGPKTYAELQPCVTVD